MYGVVSRVVMAGLLLCSCSCEVLAGGHVPPRPVPAARAACATTRFPAVEGESLKASLERMSLADRFDLNYWVSQDALVDQPAGSSRERADLLSQRFNLIVQYRFDAPCKNLRIDRMWVLPVGLPAGQAKHAGRVVNQPPPPPDPAEILYLQAHGVKTTGPGGASP